MYKGLVLDIFSLKNLDQLDSLTLIERIFLNRFKKKIIKNQLEISCCIKKYLLYSIIFNRDVYTLINLEIE